VIYVYELCFNHFIFVPHIWQVWLGGNTGNNWRQQPMEESQQQFIPLQAVKQQRNKLQGAPLQQHGSKEWPQQQQQQQTALLQNVSPHVEATVTEKVIKHTKTKLNSASELYRPSDRRLSAK
jgi:hypothetical protein